MLRLLAVVVMTAASTLPVAAGSSVAAAAQVYCGPLAITIDLNEPDAPDPDRDASDVVIGTPGDDHIETGGGQDRVCAGDGDDEVSGGAGPDILEGGDGDDVLDGGDDWDTVEGQLGADTVFGGDDSDTLDTGGGAPDGVREEAYGGADNDSFHATSSDELLDGGSGLAYLSYASGGAVGVTVDLALSGPQDTGGGGVDELIGFVSVRGSVGDDVLHGDARNNILAGDEGDDILVGREGNDGLRGNGGTDTLRGGLGDDGISLSEVFLDESPALDREEGYGGPGRDSFAASRNDELLVAGRGRDRVSFDDTCRGCSGSPARVRVDLAIESPQDTWGSGVDQLVGFEDLNGSDAHDVLLGNGHDNRIVGEFGDDVIKGRKGDDHVDGYTGSDRCSGGLGRDVVQRCERRA